MRTAVATAGVAAALLAPAAVAAQDGGEPGRLRSDPALLGRLDAAVDEGRTAAFDARLLVVAFDTAGPSVVELDVAQAEGDLRVSRGEAWTLGRSDARGYFDRAGELLQLGTVDTPGFRAVLLTDKYAVRGPEPQPLDTGLAQPVEIVERATGVVRERLYIDQEAGVVVRRETYDRNGEPVRLAAFTQLQLGAAPLLDPEVEADAAPRALTPLSDDSLDILADVGWHVPEELPAGFVLQGGYALPESEGGSVHLVYSDGLYTLSLYEQFGQLDRGSLDGAVALTAGGQHAWTWPGSQPERLVWSGDGLTFTVVSDAPDDVLVEVTSVLPHRAAPTLPARMVRGLGRVLSWAWPFD